MKNVLYNYYDILVDELNKSDNNYFFYLMIFDLHMKENRVK